MVNCLPMKDFIIFNHSPFTWRCFQNSFKKIRQSCLKILNKSSYKNTYPQDNIPFIKRTIVSRSIYIYPIYLYIHLLYINNTAELDCHYIHRLTHVSMVIAYEYRVIHLISWSIPLFSWLVKTKNVGF